MKRTGKLLAVVAIVGLLMLATTATVFAEEHPDFPPVPEGAHDVSCAGQNRALGNASGNDGVGPMEDLITLMGERLTAAGC